MINYSIKNNWLLIEEAIENVNVTTSSRINLNSIVGYKFASGIVSLWTENLPISFSGTDKFLDELKVSLDAYFLIS